MSAANTVAELQALALHHPAADAPASAVAAWYERKAMVLRHLASEGSPQAGVQAETARAHACALIEGDGGRWFVVPG